MQPSGLTKNTLGQNQDVVCSISVSANVTDIIELAWLYKEDIVTDNHRVTIYTSRDYFIDNPLAKIIQFDPLIEEDEGEYICYAMVNGSFLFQSINLQKFTSKHPVK